MPGWHCDEINCPLKGAEQGGFRFCDEGGTRFGNVWVSKGEARACEGTPAIQLDAELAQAMLQSPGLPPESMLAELVG